MFTKSIHSNNAPKALGPYSPATKLGDFVYLSGQLGIDPKTDKLVEGGIQEQTYQVLKNMEAVLAEMNLEMRHVVKTTVFMSDLANFAQMNEIYATYFADPYPARSTVEVKALPLNALIEIEAIVIDTLVYEQQVAHQHQHGGCGDGCSCGSEEEDCGEGCSCGSEESDDEGCNGSCCG
jgi:2-iminobutanoate/2-iminopropanoate deaminase